jgi:four helix bundle protein
MQAFERLDVYRVAVEFDQVMSEALVGRRGPDVDQLDRAIGSVLSNIAEASTHPSAPNKLRIYRLALGEAAECLNLINRLERRRQLPRLTYNRGRSLIERVLSMLRVLCRHTPHRQPP